MSGEQDTRPNQVIEKQIALKDLAPGVYRLSLLADDDIFVRRITTTAQHWVIGPWIYFADNVAYSTSSPATKVWTNSRHLVAETRHVEGLQTVSLGNASVTLTKTHQIYKLDRQTSELSGDLQLTAPRGDVRIVGDGYFAFSRDAMFLPYPRRLTDASDPAGEGILAVITPYRPPSSTADGWLELKSSFRLSPDMEKPKLTLSAPGLFARQGTIDIRRVSLRYSRSALGWKDWLTYVRRELAAAWHNL
jgi:hypothetical protein